MRLKETGLEYKRQMICGFYILDFVIPSLMVYFEIDGASHNNRQWYDAQRDQFLTAVGFLPIHIRNEDVATFDFKPILARPTFREWVFFRALSRANVEKGRAKRGEPMHFRAISQQTLFDDPDAILHT